MIIDVEGDRVSIKATQFEVWHNGLSLGRFPTREAAVEAATKKKAPRDEAQGQIDWSVSPLVFDY